MSQVPDTLAYTRSHEWVRLEADGSVTFGVSDHAQHALGDLVYVELPAVGGALVAGQECAVVESVKAAADVYAPVGGTVLAVNDTLASAPEQINTDPYGAGWLVRLMPSGAPELLDAAAYRALITDAD